MESGSKRKREQENSITITKNKEKTNKANYNHKPNSKKEKITLLASFSTVEDTQVSNSALSHASQCNRRENSQKNPFGRSHVPKNR